MLHHITQISTYYNEPEWLYQARLNAYQALQSQKVVKQPLISFDERDENGFGVISHVGDSDNVVCQYGVLTTLENIDYTLIELGVIVCDLQEAIAQQHITPFMWEKLNVTHQAFTNSGLYIYVPSGIYFDLVYYNVQDHSVDEAFVKSLFIVCHEDSGVNLIQHDLAFGTRKNSVSQQIITLKKEKSHDA